jgi:hypothetical protein
LAAAAGSIVYFVVCCFALFRGGSAERLVGAAMLADFIAVLALQNRRDLASNIPLFLIGDCALLIVALVTLFRWRKIWLIFGVGAQALSVLVTWAKVVSPTIEGWIYVTAGVVSTYGLVLALAAAILIRTVRASR